MYGWAGAQAQEYSLSQYFVIIHLKTEYSEPTWASFHQRCGTSWRQLEKQLHTFTEQESDT